jgi:phospholipid/cholesterol/gamma-HCH transport system substrate-binding protein
METRANYVIVGIFTLVAIVAAFAFVYWTSAIGDRGETATLRVRIPGSASGLGRGSAVLFNGVKVGDVRRVYIDVLNPTVAIADAEIDRLTPITKSTQADIGIAGLNHRQPVGGDQPAADGARYLQAR